MMQLDRRRMLAAALAAAPGLALGQHLVKTEGGRNKPSGGSVPRVFVESEFAPLRTVVLTQSEAGGLEGIAPTSSQERQRRQKKWEAERDAFGAVLVRHGVEVLRPRLFTAAEIEAGQRVGYTNFFVRDPWFTVGQFVIEGNLRFFHRRLEVLPCRDLFEKRVYPADCVYVAAPMPGITGQSKPAEGPFPMRLDQSPGPFIEGGDVLVWGKRVYVGLSGQASSELGIAWLSKLLVPHGYTVETVRVKSNTLHLDCAIGMIREGLMVACDAVLPEGLPKSLRDWERIEVTEEEALQLGTNGFAISPQVHVTDPAFRRIGDQIAKRGITVEYVDFSISRSFGGAFRCSTQPLWRETA
jgi:glycine amidinotransferase